MKRMAATRNRSTRSPIPGDRLSRLPATAPAPTRFELFCLVRLQCGPAPSPVHPTSRRCPAEPRPHPDRGVTDDGGHESARPVLGLQASGPLLVATFGLPGLPG